jgi:hypothetical protein
LSGFNGHRLKQRPAPDAVALAVNLPNPVKWHTAGIAVAIEEFKGEMVIRRKAEPREGDMDDSVCNPIIVADHKIALGVGWIPANAVKQVLDRLHFHLPPLGRLFILPPGKKRI